MKLTYFNGRGLAETSRFLLAVAGVQYEDFRYPLTVLDWSTFKMVREEFDQDKAQGKLSRSMNKLPTLEVDGNLIFQSKAIERYLANRFGLMGSDPFEAAFIDSICETIRDLKDGYQKVKSAGTVTTYFSETLPQLLLTLNNIIKSNHLYNTDLFVIGDKLSLADIVVFQFLTDYFDNKEDVARAYENCEVLSKVVANVGELDTVKKWLATRPQTPF
jgi:glutathione S-transferase